MQSPKDDFLTSFSYDKEIERAKWFKEDLDKGGWKEIHKSPGSVYWLKAFPDENVPNKVLSRVDLAMSAEMYMEVLHPKNLDKREKWDQVFMDHEILETYPDDQGALHFNRYPCSFPLWDRSFILFCPSPKEIDWFGKRAFIQIQKNAWHPSKPEGADGLVRATNGGNFFVIIPDETNPDAACTLFLLSNNNYNGWLPNNLMKRVLEKKLPASFNEFFASVIKGYNDYFKQN
ncbi:hypothetical protein OS493_036378 [Desmophyllum pertusum]|uniref:START domain-containing protein n=1 Tax=Desmophyllum pertusum TaxID=174260 RepID=A0A9W9Y8V9_9CNID|nr:hypothetical protein OS493_036378 [Desmophyllum pertusum]